MKIILKCIVLICVVIGLYGCKTLAKKSEINPVYKAKLDEIAKRPKIPSKEEIAKELEGIEPMITVTTLSIEGLGSKEADFKEEVIKNDPGLKDIMPDIEIGDMFGD